MEKKNLYLNVTIFIISVLVGAGTIMAVKADLGIMGECASSSIYYFDADGDSYGDPANSIEACSMPENYVENSDDCDDTDAGINPGVSEVCDGIDNNCSGVIDEGLASSTFYFDFDGDGYGTTSPIIIACAAPVNYASTSNDCDDANVSVNPGASEICDGLDNDCDGQIDEGLATSTYYIDADGDGYGSASSTKAWCALPDGFSENDTDCDDNSAACYPGASELCDGLDNNCDGTVDEDCNSMKTWYYDADEDGYGNASSTVKAKTQPNGYVANGNDCDDTDADINPGASEVCDGLDNDCDGQIDEGLTFSTYYYDADGDGYGFTATTTVDCAAPEDYVDNSDDCDDTDADINPGADEICGDGIDNNCNGEADENCEEYTTFYRDADGDGDGDPDNAVSASSQPNGYVANNDDCDDTDADVNPGEIEICDDSIDNNCDGQVDENCASSTTYYRDADGDGYGDPDNSIKAVSRPDGYVDNSGDCDDTDVNIHPGADEVCDGVDNDCDGYIDEGCDDEDEAEPSECRPYGEYRNHGQYVSCWAHWTNWLKKQGEITGREKGQIMSMKAKQKGNSNSFSMKFKNKGNKNK